FWQTQVTARRANPAGRVPRHRLLDEVRIAVDTRERYPYRFANRPVSIERVALSAGDYGVFVRERLVATVERKTLENFVSCLSDGTLAFQLQRLSAVPLAAVVVEAKYADLFRQPGGRANFFADVLARLQVRYHEVAVVFADSRKFAEEWAYRFLATAAADASAGSSAEEHPDEEP
ncbi:MAG TPA: ERCC4 domain-containing protein, partial [Acidimicrobiales bacterium]|nr:ERCC4 domain-containing protein [Acidimicrobiales bacterium]